MQTSKQTMEPKTARQNRTSRVKERRLIPTERRRNKQTMETGAKTLGLPMVLVARVFSASMKFDEARYWDIIDNRPRLSRPSSPVYEGFNPANSCANSVLANESLLPSPRSTNTPSPTIPHEDSLTLAEQSQEQRHNEQWRRVQQDEGERHRSTVWTIRYELHAVYQGRFPTPVDEDRVGQARIAAGQAHARQFTANLNRANSFAPSDAASGGVAGPSRSSPSPTDAGTSRPPSRPSTPTRPSQAVPSHRSPSSTNARRFRFPYGSPAHVPTRPSQPGPSRTRRSPAGGSSTQARTYHSRYGSSANAPTRSFHGGPWRAGPSQAGPSQAGPSQAGPSQAGPSQAGPSQTRPSRARPFRSRSGPPANAPTEPLAMRPNRSSARHSESRREQGDVGKGKERERDGDTEDEGEE
ncbi:uncharacterized protein LY89DRAFT_434877 [Mollisia scopiformis]|uniref:Uncharacterized protein n=1 Tax=Mollisia scopiformis TaxID=149040 RepID=A0A194XMT2_MOLSC|nr:uncharacterized protein LY89DRAFT_434877 [Mollisia scopiformis]KUJ21436.1 hypothetical protein LY89DRAFT_434877 [Mollisia scopiformis]